MVSKKEGSVKQSAANRSHQEGRFVEFDIYFENWLGAEGDENFNIYLEGNENICVVQFFRISKQNEEMEYFSESSSESEDEEENSDRRHVRVVPSRQKKLSEFYPP